MTTIEFHHKLIHVQKQLNLFAYKLTSDVESACDLLQDTNLKALNYCDKFVHDSNFKSWTFTIMKNTFINNYRHQKHNKTVNENNDLFSTIHLKMADSAFNPDSIFESKEFEQMIESVSVKQRVPFKMMNEGYRYKEIAETLNLKIGTVKSRIAFTRSLLKQQLKEDGCN